MSKPPNWLEQYEGMKDAQQEFDKKASQWQANLDTLASELEASIKALEKDRNQLKPEAFKAREAEIGLKQQQFVQYREAIQKQAQQEDQQISESVFNQINSFIEAHGKAKGYQVILGASGDGNLLYAHGGLDITQEIVTQLNKQYHGE